MDHATSNTATTPASGTIPACCSRIWPPASKAMAFKGHESFAHEVDRRRFGQQILRAAPRGWAVSE
jgi:hypothetical protein